MTNFKTCSKADEASLEAQTQASVNGFFAVMASHWERIYEETTLGACIYQDRKATALEWIEQLMLPCTARLLEVGCGAGVATVALARRGFLVTAVDPVAAMIDLTHKRVVEAGFGDRVRTISADVRQLPMVADTFDLVFALGVLPWLDDARAAVREMARVTRPGGYVLVTAESPLHLDEALDPARNPLLKPIRRSLRPILRAVKLLAPPQQLPPIYRHSRRELDSMLLDAGLHKLRGTTVGFGPFTFCGKQVLPDRIGIKVHRMLQAAANRNLPIIASSGMQHVVIATKCA
jgi:ubiquinone/menaquinone biosynthesis C-methylase UbiE